MKLLVTNKQDWLTLLLYILQIFFCEPSVCVIDLTNHHHKQK